MAIVQFIPTNSINITKNNMLAFVGVGILTALVVYKFMGYKKFEEL